MKKYLAQWIIAALVLAAACSLPGRSVHVNGFSGDTNARLAKFFRETASETGRKVAVFDGDGTVMGQAPHYLADECLFLVAAENPGKRPEIVAAMTPLSNVSIPYVQHRVRFFRGDAPEHLADLGDRCYRKYYRGKVFPPMRELVALLAKNGFEVWIVSASPELMYQKFLSRELGVPVTNVIGVKSVIRDGKITDEIVPPVPQDAGKKEAIETFIREVPLFSAGNSRGDREMIEYSRGVRMIINPDEFVAAGDTESIAAYARRKGWIVERIPDVPLEGVTYISSEKYGIRKNKTNR